MIGYGEAGQKERRSAGYLDVSIMTSKGPSGIYAVEWKEVSGNQGFEVYSESGKEVLSRDREHRRIIMEGGGGEGVATDLSIRKWFSRAVFMRQSFFAVSGGKPAKSQDSFLQLFFLFHLLMSSILKMSSFTWINHRKSKETNFLIFLMCLMWMFLPPVFHLRVESEVMEISVKGCLCKISNVLFSFSRKEICRKIG